MSDFGISFNGSVPSSMSLSVSAGGGDDDVFPCLQLVTPAKHVPDVMYMNPSHLAQ